MYPEQALCHIRYHKHQVRCAQPPAVDDSKRRDACKLKHPYNFDVCNVYRLTLAANYSTADIWCLQRWLGGVTVDAILVQQSCRRYDNFRPASARTSYISVPKIMQGVCADVRHLTMKAIPTLFDNGSVDRLRCFRQ